MSNASVDKVQRTWLEPHSVSVNGANKQQLLAAHVEKEED